jgi:hypothetical protein
VAHACKLSYSGGRDQEDYSSKPAQVNNSWDSISEKKLHKNRAGGVAHCEGPEFKPQYCKDKTKQNKTSTLNSLHSSFLSQSFQISNFLYILGSIRDV